MIELTEVGKAFAGWVEENSGLAVDESFEYTDRTVGNFAAAAFAAGAQWQAQREPTEAEIEAAARALWIDEHRDSFPIAADVVRACGEAFELDVVSSEYEERVRSMLKTARKAVSADE
jgi:hypothetical protein